MLSYRGFRIEQVIHHSNSGRLHLRPSGVIGIGAHQSIRYSILEQVFGETWAEVATVAQQADAIEFIDELLLRRREPYQKAAG